MPRKRARHDGTPMISGGRPLRFLVALVGGWIGLRTVQLWPAIDPLPAIVAALAPPAGAAVAPPTLATVTAPARTHVAIVRHAAAIPRVGHAAAAPARTADPARIALALAAIVRFGAPVPVPVSGAPMPGGASFAIPGSPITHQHARLTGSGWLIARGGAGTPFAPQLGGAQTGMRLTYALGDTRRVAVAARLSSALGNPQREAAIGLDWQPTALPIHLVAEQRIGVSQARGGPSVGMIAGLPPTPLPAGFALEGYAQAGAIARGGVEGYADGSLRLTRPVAALGPARIDMGLGAWGGAQRGAARIDAGPSAGLALPVGGRTLRLSLDWRQRLAGNARPGSGPALSIGTDF